MEYFLLNKTKFVTAFLMAFLSFHIGFSQIDRPARDGAFICANNAMPVFMVRSGFDANTFSNANIFSLELSDEEGRFDNPTVIATSGTNNTTLKIEFTFDVSDFIEPFEGSDDYRLQVRSSEGNITSQRFSTAIYYVESNEIIRLNTEPDTLCDAQGTISAFPNDFEEYEWYRTDLDAPPGSGGTLIVGETSNTLEVSQIGRYFFRINIGGCSNSASTGDAATSSFTDVLETNGVAVSIEEGPGALSACSNEFITLTSSNEDPELVYQWFKDNVELEDVTTGSLFVSGSETPMLTVSGIDMEGSYTVSAALNEVGSCTTQSTPVDIELQNPRINITSENTVILLPPGEPKILTAEVIRGNNPEITWLLNGTDIPDSNTTSLSVTQEGTYTVRLTADSPCSQDNTVFAAGEIQVVAAEDLVLTIDYNDPAYTDCGFDEVTLEVIEVTATSGGQTISLTGTDLQNIEVDWQRDGDPTGETEESILIDSASENGSYRAVIGTATSNALPVTLALDSFEISKDPETLPLGESSTLSLGLEDVTGYTFQWIRNNVEIAENSTSATFTATEPGLYSVMVSVDPCGSVTIGPTSLNTGSAVIPNVITPNGDGINDDWVLTGELTLNEAVEINIYASNGELDYSTTSYDGEWPAESQSNAVGTIYYYVISMNNNPVEQGSITIIR